MIAALSPRLLYFQNQRFSCSFVPHPFVKLGSLNGGTVSHIEIVNRCIPENNPFGQHDHTIISLLTHLDFVSLLLHYKAAYDIHSF